MTESDDKPSFEQNLRDYLTRFISAPRPSRGRSVRGAVLLISITSGVVVAGLIVAGGLALANHRGSATPPTGTSTASPSIAPTPATTPTPSPSSSPNAQACGTSQLRLILVRSNPSNAQQASAILGLINISTATCELEGYPGIALFGGSGLPLRVAFVRGEIYEIPDPGEQVVVLTPRGTAYFGIGWIIIDGGSVGLACVDASRLEVTLPTQSGALSLPVSINQICPPGSNLPQTPQLGVTAIGPPSAFSG